jgi:hypothetical protein
MKSGERARGWPFGAKRSGLGVGLSMLAIAAAVAACEHEAQRDAALGPHPAYFESEASRSAARVDATQAPSLDRSKPALDRDDAPRAGHTDRFLWDDRASATGDGGNDEDAGPLGR